MPPPQDPPPRPGRLLLRRRRAARPLAARQALRRRRAPRKPRRRRLVLVRRPPLGVHSAMPMASAVRLCPQLDHRLRARHSAYSAVSRQVMVLLHTLTPLVEQISIDEAFLDVSDRLSQPNMSPAACRHDSRPNWACPARSAWPPTSWSPRSPPTWARPRHTGDGPPNAILVVPPGQEAAFLAPAPRPMRFGASGPRPPSACRTGHATPSATSCAGPRPTPAPLWQVRLRLCPPCPRHRRPPDRHRARGQVGQPGDHLRARRQRRRGAAPHPAPAGRRRQPRAPAKRLAGATVKLKLRWPDFTTITRQVTLPAPTRRCPRHCRCRPPAL